MLIYGFAPSNMLKETIIPIPKNKLKSINDSGNYRGITRSSIIGKLDKSFCTQKQSVPTAFNFM